MFSRFDGKLLNRGIKYPRKIRNLQYSPIPNKWTEFELWYLNFMDFAQKAKIYDTCICKHPWHVQKKKEEKIY